MVHVVYRNIVDHSYVSNFSREIVMQVENDDSDIGKVEL